MFKQVLNFLKGKKSPGFASQNEQSAAAKEKELISVYDAYGRELKITRQEWLEKILVPNLEQAWDDPDKLYDLILSALKDGFVSEVDDASSRLLGIDPAPERSHTIRGIVLMKTGRIDEAEAILQAGIERVGETGILLTNLAKVYAERGDSGKTDDILWRAIQLDPNQDNGLGWWLAIRREQEGEAGYILALQRAASITGSWRPQLWLARHHMEQGDASSAKALYESILRSGSCGSEALVMISGDLGNNGCLSFMIEFVAPVFDPERHDPRTGMNLLQAYLELGRRQDGEALLSRLYAMNLPPYKEHLDHYASAFQKLQADEARPRRIDSPEQLEIETIALELPVWRYNLHNPTWLFGEKSDDAPRVAFFSFAKCASGTDHAEEQREDDIGRLTRAIPLYLAESVHYWTELQSSTLIPVVKGGGPVVLGASGNDAGLCDKLGENSTYLVTGEIDASKDVWRIACRLWDCAERSCLLEESVEAAVDDVGAAVLLLEQRLLARLGRLRTSPMDAFYVRPPAEAMTPYLVELGQSLMLSLISNGVAPKDGLWGERNMLEWPLRMALQWPKAEVPKLMYLSGLAKAASFQSGILHEFKSRTLEFIKDARGIHSPAAKLEPLVWQIFDMAEELMKHQEGLGPGAKDEYRQWLSRVLDASEPART